MAKAKVIFNTTHEIDPRLKEEREAFLDRSGFDELVKQLGRKQEYFEKKAELSLDPDVLRRDDRNAMVLNKEWKAFRDQADKCFEISNELERYKKAWVNGTIDKDEFKTFCENQVTSSSVLHEHRNWLVKLLDKALKYFGHDGIKTTSVQAVNEFKDKLGAMKEDKKEPSVSEELESDKTLTRNF